LLMFLLQSGLSSTLTTFASRAFIVRGADADLDHLLGKQERFTCVHTHTRFRFVHTSEEHIWASNNRQRVLTQDDGISIASTSIGSLGHAVDELNAQADDTNTQPEDALVDILASREDPLRPDGATFGSESASLADPSTRAPTPLPLPSCVNSSASDVAAAQDVTVVGCSSNAAFFDADGFGLHTDTAIEREDISGVNDEGKEELDGIDLILVHIVRDAELDVSCRSHRAG
jgi:hypothetical protein